MEFVVYAYGFADDTRLCMDAIEDLRKLILRVWNESAK